MNKYPVYIISKGRHDCCLTANFMLKDKVDFKIVIEPQEKDLYAKIYGEDQLLILPFSNLGKGSIPARNWCWEDSISKGHEKHWLFDDNIRKIRRKYKKKRVPCDTIPALKCCEEFTDRYENIAISGMNYTFFAPDDNELSPFFQNVHVYSNLLIRNDIKYRWRGRYNEDTDLCLQALSGNWCTILFNNFLIEKMHTMTMKGGNSDQLYKGDGRTTMARSLERVWRGVVYTDRRFQRPQHKIKNEWKHFDTQLIRRKDIDWKKLEGTTNEFGQKLVQKDNIKNEQLKEWYDRQQKDK
tara:strand:- start:1732 stop:2622 length:891 start_codon:yes stop_codon:yes gene_type:complete